MRTKRKRKMKSKNNPVLKFGKSEILTIVAAAGVVATFIFTVRDTRKAEEKLEELKEETEELTKLEIVKTVAPCYAPSVTVAGATVFFIFGSNYLSRKKQLSILSAYTLAHSKYTRYKDAVKDIYGEEGHQKVLDSLAVEKANEVNLSALSIVENSVRMVDTNEYTRLFYDTYLNRYFESTLSAVMDAEYHLNRNYILRGYVSVYEWCEFLGIEAYDGSDYKGWDAYDEHEGIFWIDFEHHITKIEGDLECVVIDMVFAPGDLNMELVSP